ncbi:helix-turn-helix domain-containing protein [Geminisphaera colitermitum]|uniref:helix-turn-helix domain-containing protein n=1 Tax=Geminisphaera colitermitum TaxID=1148786 RepID=UPI0005BE337A|nr:helix-turn-helix transcriptional regulator [Geminisphaera colitermitum]
MSHLSVALKKLTKGRRQQDIADMVGMPRSTVNQYARGTRRVAVEVLEQLLKAFSEPEQRVIVKAYLNDETPASWFGRVRIDFKDTGRAKAGAGGAVSDSLALVATLNNQTLPATDDKALSAALATLITRARENNDVRQVILDLAAIVQ